MNFSIMKAKDFSCCALTLMQAFKEKPWNENWTYEQAYNRILEIMSSKNARGYVLYDQNIVVAMLCGRVMTYLDYKEFVIDEFNVHPLYQGKKIGTQMLQYVQTALKQEIEKISYFILNTKKSYSCEFFYQVNGFEIDSSWILMRKKITES